MKNWVLARFSRKLTLAIVSFLLVAMAASGAFLTRILKERMTNELESSLRIQARLIGSQLPRGIFSAPDPAGLKSLAADLERTCGCRVAFVAPDGRSFGDAEAGEDRRDLLYASAPVSDVAPKGGLVRLAIPFARVDERLGIIQKTILRVAAVLLLVAAVAALLLAGTISRPVREMSGVAQRIADGDYSARVREFPLDELGNLGRSVNYLAERIAQTIAELSSEKVQLEAMLSNMVEAVVAVDEHGKVLVANQASARLFSLDASAARGRAFTDVIRQNQLIEILRGVLRDRAPRTDEVHLFVPEESVLESQAVPLQLSGAGRGAMLVLHDITRLRRLEQMRKEFVANVSHELRTPVASIKGFAETLKDGAKDDAEHRDEFIESIVTEADHMARLVDDLLDLAAIESGRRPLNLSEVQLPDIAQEVLEQLRPIADKRNVALDLERSPVSSVRADRGQIRQVFTNLIDNAVKFNKEGGRVAVRFLEAGDSVSAVVEDTGSGIPEADLPRIFERFYRVDKARSRDLGGTGLGLAIVKHIAEAHGGSVSVKSAEGKGSTFTVSLPIRR